MAKTAAPDITRFKANKSRVTDFYEHCADSIREKKTLMMAATSFAEMSWLCQEIDRLGGIDKTEGLERYQKIKKFVARVCEEQAAAVRTGQFIKVRADIFGAWRFLVRALETCLKRLLDTEDQFALGERLSLEHTDRIVLDLEEGLGDEDEDDPPPRRRVYRERPTQPAPMRVSGLGTSEMVEDDLPGGGPLTSDELLKG